MNEKEIITLLLDVAQGNKPSGDTLSPELRNAISALYHYGYDAGYKEAKSVYKTDSILFTQADIDRKIKENNDYWRERMEDVEDTHNETIKRIVANHERAVAMLNQVIDIISE